MAFCLATEEFVDDKLSNWYVRRNRRRFWKSEKGEDKLAAYQTLYTVLLTLTKLCAPVIPFLAETLYQNLTGRAAGVSPLMTASSSVAPSNQGAHAPRSPESVHHCTFPEADESLIDAGLSQDMDALLRLVSLGSAARNIVKIKVRQPLAELKVQPGSDAERRAVERFSSQIMEELNIKTVSLHDETKPGLLNVAVKLNPRLLGPKLGGSLTPEMRHQIESELTSRFSTGREKEPFTIRTGPNSWVSVGFEDAFVSYEATETGWTGVADRKTQVSLDARITPELAREGLAREVVRHVQNCRKDAGLEMEDRIVLNLGAEGRLAEAIQAHRDYIAAETLVAQWSDKPLGDGAFRVEVKIEGQPMAIELLKFQT
jgi:isoleucyl-tRNA synthetase